MWLFLEDICNKSFTIIKLYRESQKVSLKIDIKKTKIIFNNYIPDYDIKIDYKVIESRKTLYLTIS